MIRILIRSIIISGFLLSALSCRPGRVYLSPERDLYNHYRDFPAEDTITIADIPWQEFFGDPYLLALMAEGIDNNYDMGVAYARIRAAEASLEMARLAYFPTVSATASVTENLVSTGAKGKKVFGYSSPQYSLGITASWEADLWGKLSAQKRSQYAQFLNSVEYRNLIQTSLIANIANAYYFLLALDERLAITRSTVSVLQETVETMQALMDAGLQNGASVKQSQALYYATLVTVPDIESQIKQTENSLCELLGREPSPITRSSLSAQDSLLYVPYEIPVQALSRRPDVQQAELALISAFELTNAARAAFYPALSLGSGSFAGYASTTLSKFFRPENLIATIIGSVAQPIFSRGQLKGNLKIARAQQDEALLDFAQTVLAAVAEVNNYLYSFYYSLEKNPVRKKQIETLQTAVYFTGELLKAGEANYTEVLSAQQNLLSARLDRTSDRLEQLQYLVSLYKALGGGTPVRENNADDSYGFYVPLVR